MRRIINIFMPTVVAAIALLAAALPANAGSTGVQDNGNFFSKDAIAKADSLIADIRAIDHRDVLVITYPTIPADRADQYQAVGHHQFFDQWVQEISRDNGVDGIVILLTRKPGHLQVDVGNKTRQRYFTVNDRDELRDTMVADLGTKQYDQALLHGLRFIRDRMNRTGTSAGANSSGAIPPSSNNVPWNPPINQRYTPGFPVGGWLCAGFAIIAILFFVINIVSRSRGYGGGYNSPPPGGYPPGYPGGYQGGYGYGGGGGGFGRGLLGGILGGALGSWAYDRFFQSGNTGYYNPTTPSSTGGNFGSTSDDTDTSYSSSGADFDTSTPDSSNSSSDFGSSSSGGDFGGGGDSGGGGGDFGGGDSGSTGGDF